MNTITTASIALAAVLTAAGSASAISPFTETFPTGDANWRGDTNAVALGYTPTGGVGAEQDGFVSSSFNFVDSTGGGFGGGVQTLFRGEAFNNASNGAFVGNYNNLDAVSFWVRHDFTEPVNFFIRLSSAINFPSVNFQAPNAVQPNTWTEIVAPLDASQWVLTGTPFEAVLADIGNFQLGVDRLDQSNLPGLDQEITFDLDRVTLVPTPGVAAMLGLAGLAACRRRRG